MSVSVVEKLKYKRNDAKKTGEISINDEQLWKTRNKMHELR